MTIMQGDQLAVPFLIKSPSGTLVTTTNCTGVKIQIGDVLKYYPNGGVTFNSTTNQWLYAITQTESLNLNAYYKVQAQVNFGGNPNVIRGTEVKKYRILDSLITVPWSDDE